MPSKGKSSVFTKIFISPDKVKSILVKRLAPNDDSGRHGVLVPVSSYSMFPNFKNFDPEIEENYTEEVTTLWKVDGSTHERKSRFKHYHRYPERRLTCLNPSLNKREETSILVVGRIASKKYEVHLVSPSDPNYRKVTKECEFPTGNEPIHFLDLKWSPESSTIGPEKSIDRFLKEFDKVNKRGPIKSLRSGDTGIGYTFETIIGLEENNFSGPDFEDIEIKCFGNNKRANVKKNLFLKAPTWMDSHSNMKDRLLEYGYKDIAKDRIALYSSVTSKTNVHHFKFVVSRSEKKVFLNFKNRNVAFWSFQTLAGRLAEKHQKAVFVGAKKLKKGKQEYFHYQTVSYCTNPFVDSFINLIEGGQVVLELRMHLPNSGPVRDRGTGFRILESHLPELYSKVVQLR